MASDPTKPLLRLTPQDPRDRPAGKSSFIPPPAPFSQDRQTNNFSPKFQRIADVLGRDPAGLELRTDPTALAPERLLVFEVRGAIQNFAAAVGKVEGLELVDEEDLTQDEQDKSPVVYLMVPDVRALHELESLWRRWQSGSLISGETPWRDVFALLRDLRPWGIADRVQSIDGGYLAEEIDGRADDALIRLEIELVYRHEPKMAATCEQAIAAAVTARDGRVVCRSRIDDIAYHALLVDLPVRSVREILKGATEGIAGLEPVMHIRAQSIATGIDLADASDSQEPIAYGGLGDPILALLDGIPVAGHPLLTRHLTVEDQFGLEAGALVAGRTHGTAMASLIVHGDRNAPARALPRRIHVIPVMGAQDAFPNDRLVVDMIYMAVMAMRGGSQPTAPGVLIVNLSLGNRRRPFHGQMSPWARLLDRLAYQFGILFLVSAGNNTDVLEVPAFPSRMAFEDAPSQQKATGVLEALNNVKADRRLFSPAETINGVTVGACNQDAVTPGDRAAAVANIDPYPHLPMSNPSSALGPGFASSVKPDILMPGAREHLRVVKSHTHIDVRPAGPARSAGLKVAAPPRDGRENVEGFTNGTSAAAALASRTCHRIYDALEAAYGDAFTHLPHIQKAVVLKALLVHPAQWPAEAADFIRTTVGPADNRQHVKQRDNIRRFLGYGFVDSDDAVACAADRATFWATGTLQPDKVTTILVPIPVAIGGQSRPHALSATLAWFTPVAPGRQKYRAVRLKIEKPDELAALAVKARKSQPDINQSNKGTVSTRCWAGNKAPAVGPDMSVRLTVRREPDQGPRIDDPIHFALAVTLTMPGVVEIYEQVRQRLALPTLVPAV